MVETNAARIIRDATQQKFYVIFADVIFEFVSNHRELSSLEKLIWFNLARKSNLDPNYSCRLTHQQIATIVNVSYDTAYRAMRNLKEQGFIKVYFDDSQRINVYTPILPAEGLSAIENASDRGGKSEGSQKNSTILRNNIEVISSDIQRTLCKVVGNPSAKTQGSPFKNAGTPPAKMQTLLINNNIINHNIHNQPERLKTTASQNVENADALVCDFKKLQRQYQHLRPTERMRQVNAQFSSDEMQIILTSIIETQKALEIEETRQKRVSVEFQNKLQQAKPLPKERTPHEQAKLVEFEFEGEHYLIEEAVKNQIMYHIPQLYHQQKIKGTAANKSLKTLLKEILYYVAKAGSMLLKPVIQLKRYYIARKICLKGDWERPKGMVLNEAISKENSWHSIKLREMREAKLHLQTVGCH